MTSLVSKIRKLSGWDWWLLVKAVFWTGIGRILILFVPLRNFSFLLGTHQKETPELAATENMILLRSVGVAISRANRIVPWRCLCYEQAIAAKMILRGYGLETTMYYGVAKDINNQLIAHAWIRCGNYIVTGRPGMKRFTVVGTFA
jgi:hypothetical protein